MSSALAQANQKLYFASLHLQLLERELAAGQLPARALQQALGESARYHLREAYGWFLLELLGGETQPAEPPASMTALRAAGALSEPLRGELLELELREQQPGWLAQLLAADNSGPLAAPTDPALVAVGQCSWGVVELRQWQTELEQLLDRMSDSLSEW